MKWEIVRLSEPYFKELKKGFGERERELIADFSGLFWALIFNDHAFAVLRCGECIGAGGIFPLYGSVAMAWAFITPELKRHPFFLFREAKKFLERVGEEGFSSVEALAVDGFEAGMRFVERLGFTPDGGSMKGIGPLRVNLIKYVRVFRCVSDTPQQIN